MSKTTIPCVVYFGCYNVGEYYRKYEHYKNVSIEAKKKLVQTLDNFFEGKITISQLDTEVKRVKYLTIKDIL